MEITINITSIISAVYLYILALAFALVEIQIEGKHPWAKKLPTTISDDVFNRFYNYLTGKKLTVYHFYMFLIVFLLFHLPFVADYTGKEGIRWTWQQEFIALSEYFVFVVVWDFLWIVLNPFFTIRKFTPKGCSWHVRWKWNVPIDYTGSLIIAFVFAFAGYWAYQFLFMMLIQLALLAITILFAPAYKEE